MLRMLSSPFIIAPLAHSGSELRAGGSASLRAPSGQARRGPPARLRASRAPGRVDLLASPPFARSFASPYPTRRLSRAARGLRLVRGPAEYDDGVVVHHRAVLPHRLGPRHQLVAD